MKAVDSTFPIDVLKEVPSAGAKARELEAAGERLAIPAPALAEVMVGAHHAGGWLLRETLELVTPFEVLPTDAEAAHEAGRLGAEMIRRGRRMSAGDLLVAATCRLRGLILVTRDGGLAEVPGLAVEHY
jgi:tRNA(fMet)-specific endonuclease VapC